MAKVKPRKLDFTDVKESSGINPKHVESGEYIARCTEVRDHKAKDGTPMWLYLFTPDDYKSASYPSYVKLDKDNLWKLRNIFIAAGLGKLVEGKRAMTVDPNKLVGKRLGILLEEEEYEGKMKSVIEAFIPLSDMEESDDAPEDPDVDEDEDDEEEEEAPAPKKKRKPAPEPVEEEEDEEEEDEEEEEPAPKAPSKRTLKRRAEKEAAAKAAAAEEDDDDEDDEEEEAPAPKKSKKAKKKPAPVEDDDDDEDLDLDDM